MIAPSGMGVGCAAASAPSGCLPLLTVCAGTLPTSDPRFRISTLRSLARLTRGRHAETTENHQHRISADSGHRIIRVRQFER